jgi:DNA-binding response OmpR family regulator
MPQVLLVVSDAERARVLQKTLSDQGMLVDCTGSTSNLETIASRGYDLIILDWSRFDNKSREMIQKYRMAGGYASIIALVKPAGAGVRIRALEAGVDDCVAMPGEDMRELCARLRALLRRPRFVAMAPASFVNV